MKQSRSPDWLSSDGHGTVCLHLGKEALPAHTDPNNSGVNIALELQYFFKKIQHLMQDFFIYFLLFFLIYSFILLI